MSLFNRKTNVKHISIPVDDKSSQQESENAKNNEEPILAIKAILIATKRAKSFIEKMMEIKARNQKAKKTNQQEKELYQKEMAIFKTIHETLINIRDLIEEYHLFKGCKIFLMPWNEKQKKILIAKICIYIMMISRASYIITIKRNLILLTITLICKKR